MTIVAHDIAVIDERSFAQLYEEHRTPLHLFCVARTGDPVVAEDIVQDVFERAFAQRARYDPARPFWPWIAAIAGRECVDTHRRRAYAQHRTLDLAAAMRAEPFDGTSAAVLGRLEGDAIKRHLRDLPARQRTALMLFAVDGWSYAEIATYLGGSVEIVKALINRARARLRAAGVRSLAAVAGVARTVRARLQQALPWSPGTASACAESLAAWGHSLASNVVVVSLVLGGLLGGGGAADAPAERPTTGNLPNPPSVAPVTPPARPAPVDVGPTPTTRVSVDESPARGYAGATEAVAHDAVAAVLPPPQEETPETISGTDAVASTGDDTVFVAGSNRTMAAGGSTLLVSRDGGTSWRRPRAVGLGTVVKLLLPPAYPADDRVFAATSTGLQVSRDGGERFETLVALPAVADAVVSPAFDGDDPSILLVAGGRLFEYRTDTDVVRPVLLGHQYTDQLVTTVAYAPGYPMVPDILVGFRLPRTHHLELRAGRCTRHRTVELLDVPSFTCHDFALADPRSEVLKMVVPSGPGPGAVWLANLMGVYVSTDEGSTFAHSLARGEATSARGYYESYVVWDLAVLPSPDGMSAVLARHSTRVTHRNWADVVMRRGEPLLRTDDGGRTWTPLAVDMPRFDDARAVTVTRTGRIVAAGLHAGLACSADGGRTWARTCPAADTA